MTTSEMTGSNSTTILQANRMNSVYAGGHKATDVLKAGQWKGQRCFILGGGESLKGFDFSLLRGEKVIAVNRAFESYPNADIWYAMDVALYNSMRSGVLSEGEKYDVYKLWQEFQGIKMFLCPINYYKFYDKIHYVRRNTKAVVSNDLNQGIHGGNNSGFGALMLALTLRANPIFLLGYDLKIRETTHYHSGYPKQDKEALAKKLVVFTEQFEKFKDEYPKDTRIINLCLDSALECFPKDHICNVFRSRIEAMFVAQGRACIDVQTLDALIHEYKGLYCNMVTRGKNIMEMFDKLLSEMEIHEEQKTKEVQNANL